MIIATDQTAINQAVKRPAKLLGLDVGSKRIGVALCDETWLVATPKLVLTRQSNVKDFAKILEIIEQNKAVGVVIGLPLQMNGGASEMSKFVEKFAQNLDEFLEKKLPIFLFDERLSSFEAREFNASELSRKKNKFYDDIAASVILQNFIDLAKF